MMVESEHHACFMTRNVMKHAFTSNLPYYFLKCIKSAMKILRHGWNIRNSKNKNLQNKSNKEFFFF